MKELTWKELKRLAEKPEAMAELRKKLSHPAHVNRIREISETMKDGTLERLRELLYQRWGANKESEHENQKKKAETIDAFLKLYVESDIYRYGPIMLGFYMGWLYCAEGGEIVEL